MTAPKATVSTLTRVAPGVDHGSILDERLQFRSETYLVETAGGRFWIDPIGVDGLEGPIAGILLTGPFHQRACWDLRSRLGCPVRVPAGSAGLEGEPDSTYRDGEEVAPGLVAHLRHGPANPHAVLFLGPGRALFCGDLAMRASGNEPFELVPADHHADFEKTAASARTLVDFEAACLCPAHGVPESGGVEAVRRALRNLASRDTA